MAEIGKSKKSIGKKVINKLNLGKHSKKTKKTPSLSQSVSPNPINPPKAETPPSTTDQKKNPPLFARTLEPYQSATAPKEKTETVVDYLNELDTWADQYFSTPSEEQATRKEFDKRFSDLINGNCTLNLKNLGLTSMPPLPKCVRLQSIHLSTRDALKLNSATLMELKEDYEIVISSH